MFFDFFRRKGKKSSDTARERLQITLAHERLSNKAPFLDDLKEDIIKVISKYVKIDSKSIDVNLQKDSSIEVLEINIPMK